MAKTKEPPAGSVTNFEQPVPGDPDFAKIHYTDKSGKEVFGNYRRSELLNEIKTMDGMVYGGD